MNVLCSVKRWNFEDCEERDAHYRLVREGKRSFNLRPQKMADFLGQNPKNCPVSASFFWDREWGQKYNIFPSAAHSTRSSPFDQPRKIVVRRSGRSRRKPNFGPKKDFCRPSFRRPTLLSSIHNFSPAHAFASSSHLSWTLFFWISAYNVV